MAKEQNSLSKVGGGARRAVGFLVGARQIKANIGIVRSRASLSLLRGVIRNSRATAAPEPLEGVSKSQLELSSRAHAFMIACMSPIFLYSMFMSIKWVVGLIRYDVWGIWLVTGPALIVISLSQILVSAASREAIRKALVESQ